MPRNYFVVPTESTTTLQPIDIIPYTYTDHFLAESTLLVQAAASADFKATGSAEATATSIPRETPPLTPATPYSVSTTPTITSGASDIKEFFGGCYEQGCANSNDDAENTADDGGGDETSDGDGGDNDGHDPRKDGVVGDLVLLDGGDDGGMAETGAVEVR